MEKELEKKAIKSVWEENREKGRSLQLYPIVTLHWMEFTIDGAPFFKLAINMVQGKDDTEEKKEHNCKQPLAAWHELQTSCL